MSDDLESAWAALEGDAAPRDPQWLEHLFAAHRAELDLRVEDAARELASARAAGAPGSYENVLSLIGHRIEVRSGEPPRIESALAAARELAVRLEATEPSTAARALHLVAVASMRLGRLDEAEVVLGGLIARPLPSPFETWVVDSFAQTLIGQGAWVEGGRAMAALLRHRREANDRVGAAITAGNLARLHAELGEHAASRAIAADALASLGAEGSALTRLRLQTFVTMASVAVALDSETIARDAEALERCREEAGSSHYLRGFAALALSQAAALRGDDTSAARWLDAARAELVLPSQRTLVAYHEARLHPELLDDPNWRRELDSLCDAAGMVTEGEMRARMLAADRGSELELVYRRALASNNPLWLRWADDLAQRVAPELLAEQLARRFSGFQRAELAHTKREEVTIVFADLAGFTARAVELDPDDVMSTVRGLFELAVPVMTRFGVSPITYMGDGLLAIARGRGHERRAFDFARGLLERTARVSALRRILRDPWPLDLRAGVASGPVVLGTLGSALKLDFAAIGLTTNLAARLQTSAMPREVVCSERTATACGLELPFEALELKGFEKHGRVRACRVRCS